MDFLTVTVKGAFLRPGFAEGTEITPSVPKNTEIHFAVVGSTLKSFINTDVWVQVHYRVANGTVLIVEYVRYCIIARAFSNSVFST